MATTYGLATCRTLARSAPKCKGRLDSFQAAGSTRFMSNLVNSGENKAFPIDTGALAKELESRGVPPFHTEAVMGVLNAQKAQHRLSEMQDDIKKLQESKEFSGAFYFLWCSGLTIATVFAFSK